MIDYAIILVKKYAGSEWHLNGDDYEGLTWLSDTPKPSKKTLDDLWPEVKTLLESQKNQKIAARESAITKLAALGLNEDEAKAIIG